MSLQIDAINIGQSRVTIFLNGVLDTRTAPELESYLEDGVGKDIQFVAFDLKDLNYISSAGLRTFAKARRQFAERGGKVIFGNPSPQVAKVFEIVKAIPVNEVFSSTKELDAYLDEIQAGASS